MTQAELPAEAPHVQAGEQEGTGMTTVGKGSAPRSLPCLLPACAAGWGVQGVVGVVRFVGVVRGVRLFQCVPRAGASARNTVYPVGANKEHGASCRC